MRGVDYIAYTFRNFTRAQLRLLLTVSAVVIGAALVVVMTSVGGGIQRNVLEDIRASGGLNEILVSSAFRTGPGPGGAARGGVLDQSAIETIAALPGVTAVLPELLLLGGVELAYQDLTAQPLVLGVPAERAAAYGLAAAQGTAAPERGQVVLGARVAEGFFDANRQRVAPPALYNDTVRLVSRRAGAAPSPAGGGLPGFAAPAAPTRQEQELTVAGLLAPSGTRDDFTLWVNEADLLDALEFLTGRRPDLSTEGYQALRVKTASTEQVRDVQQAITALDFQATSPLSVLDDVNRGMLILQVLLGTIGLVALIVSGLGVANTMLMATFERTREIGILKALGATETQIARLFLFEASLIGLLGALAGLLLGWIATQVINLIVLQILASQVAAAPSAPRTVLYTPAWVPPAVVGLAWLVAVLAGLYPALRASRLNIARALRAD